MFGLQQIADLSKTGSLAAQWTSRSKFWVDFESQLAVLPDARALIGVHHKNKSSLMAQSITDDSSPTTIGTHRGEIRAVLLTSGSDSLLVGDKTGRVTHYELQRGSWVPGKVHVHVDVERIISGVLVGNLAVFGGSNRHFRLIDVNTRKCVGPRVETAVRRVFSVQLCSALGKHLVVVCGKFRDYSASKSDLFEVVPVAEQPLLSESNSSHLSALIVVGQRL